MDVVVREARESELDEIGALTVEIYDGLVAPEYLEVLRDARTRWTSPATKLLVAFDDGTDGLLGTAVYAAPGSPWRILGEGDGEAEIRMLGVLASARGRGVGEALVRACIAQARVAGTPWVVLTTQTDMTDAQRLYARLGFVRVPERDWDLRPGLSLMSYAVEVPA
jgi:ribosomal protein S18 acetylase RimI-like enzyme